MVGVWQVSKRSSSPIIVNLIHIWCLTTTQKHQEENIGYITVDDAQVSKEKASELNLPKATSIYFSNAWQLLLQMN